MNTNEQQRPSRSYLHLPNGTVWPDPLDPRDTQWALRYGKTDRSDVLFAASTLAAYRELIWMPERRRREVIKALREAAGKDEEDAHA